MSDTQINLREHVMRLFAKTACVSVVFVDQYPTDKNPVHRVCDAAARFYNTDVVEIRGSWKDRSSGGAFSYGVKLEDFHPDKVVYDHRGRMLLQTWTLDMSHKCDVMAIGFYQSVKNTDHEAIDIARTH